MIDNSKIGNSFPINQTELQGYHSYPPMDMLYKPMENVKRDPHFPILGEHDPEILSLHPLSTLGTLDRNCVALRTPTDRPTKTKLDKTPKLPFSGALHTNQYCRSFYTVRHPNFSPSSQAKCQTRFQTRFLIAPAP